MGVGSSQSREDMQRALRGVFVVEFISASALPDIIDASYFVRMRILDTSRTQRSAWVRSISRRLTRDPVWHSFRDMEVFPEDGDRFEIELCADRLGSCETLAAGTFPIERNKRDPTTYWLALIDKYAANRAIDVGVNIRIVEPPRGDRKLLFFVRHGESRWNEAVRERYVREMITRVDHSLTRDGIENALALSDMWRARAGRAPDLSPTWLDALPPNLDTVPDDVLEALFGHADKIFSSPLTRAVQTAQIVLKDHPAVQQHGIILLRAAREVKRALSLDTVGKAVGADIAVRAKELLARVVGDMNAEKLSAPLDPYDCQSVWHTMPQAVDTEGDVRTRMMDLMSTLRFSSFTTGILVGHSLALQAFSRMFATRAFTAAKPALASLLAEKKLANSACICMLLDFSPELGPGILDVRPMFGSALQPEPAPK